MSESDILSQADIDALLNENLETTDSGVVIFSPEGDRFDPKLEIDVKNCDFRNPAFLTETELRQVRIRHESFIHYLAARLSMFIRMDISMKMSRLHTMSYEEFTSGIPSPTFISIFRIAPLTGVGIVSINPRLAMTLVNRMLGGKGHSITDERYLTDIEKALIEDVVKVMMEEWTHQWGEIEGLKPEIVGRENNGRFLQTSTRDSIVLVLDIEGTMGDITEKIQLGIPYYLMEPIIKRMQEKTQEISRTVTNKRAQWLPAYSDISVDISAEWDVFQATVGDLLRLKPGDILEMPKGIINQTVVRIRDTSCFVGEAGIEGDHVAVKITEKISRETK